MIFNIDQFRKKEKPLNQQKKYEDETVMFFSFNKNAKKHNMKLNNKAVSLLQGEYCYLLVDVENNRLGLAVMTEEVINNYRGYSKISKGGNFNITPYIENLQKLTMIDFENPQVFSIFARPTEDTGISYFEFIPYNQAETKEMSSEDYELEQANL